MNDGPAPSPWRRLAVLAAIVGSVLAVSVSGLGESFSIDGVKSLLDDARAFLADHPVRAVAAFIAVQVAALAICLPGAVLAPALAGGALFGTVNGTIILLVALTLGDSLGFLLARYVAGDFFSRRFAGRLATLPKGDSALYLLALRLMAIVPYFVVNVAMATTRMPLRIFAPVSFAGLVPATILYVGAGSQLSRIERASDIWTGPMIAIFVAIGILPLGARWAYRRFGERGA